MEKIYIPTSAIVANNPPAQLHGLQIYLDPYLAELEMMWWFVFAATVVGLIAYLVKAYRRAKK